jgi:hypothetical protein
MLKFFPLYCGKITEVKNIPRIKTVLRNIEIEIIKTQPNLEIYFKKQNPQIFSSENNLGVISF